MNVPKCQALSSRHRDVLETESEPVGQVVAVETSQTTMSFSYQYKVNLPLDPSLNKRPSRLDQVR